MGLPMITSLYAALLAILIVVLGARVALRRRQRLIGLGSGDDDVLHRRIRVHGNAIENIPLAIMLLLLNELTGASPVCLHIYGSAFVLGRLFHIHGLSGSPGKSFGRVAGMVLTWSTLLVMASHLLARYFAMAF